MVVGLFSLSISLLLSFGNLQSLRNVPILMSCHIYECKVVCSILLFLISMGSGILVVLLLTFMICIFTIFIFISLSRSLTCLLLFWGRTIFCVIDFLYCFLFWFSLVFSLFIISFLLLSLELFLFLFCCGFFWLFFF